MNSRERFEAWANEAAGENPHDWSAWTAWQAAEAQAAQRCAELLCIHCMNGLPYDIDAKYHPANHRGGVFPCNASRIRAEYPEAFK